MLTRQPVLQASDAGPVIIVVLVFPDGQFPGAVKACGCLLNDGELVTFLIEMIAGVEDKTSRKLTEGIGAITVGETEQIVRFIRVQIERTVEGCNQSQRHLI